MNEHARIISQNIKRLAFEAGKTQADISNDLGINKSTLSCWMNGARIPKMKNIDVLCRYFGVKRSDIMDEKRSNGISVNYEQRFYVAFQNFATDLQQRHVKKPLPDEPNRGRSKGRSQLI